MMMDSTSKSFTDHFSLCLTTPEINGSNKLFRTGRSTSCLLNVVMLIVYRRIFGSEDDDGISEADDNEEESDLAIVKRQRHEHQAAADAIAANGQVHCSS